MNNTKVDKLPRGYIPAWASRAVSIAVNVVLIMQVSFYATDVLGMNPALVGALFLGARVFDAITDLVFGYYINKTNTRWGKARPFEIMIIPAWIFTIALFSVPNLGVLGQSIYILVFFVLSQAVCGAILAICDPIYMGRSLPDQVQQGKVLAINGLIVMLFGIIVSIMLPILIDTWGRQPGGWTRISMVIGIPMMLIGMGRFLFIKEKVSEEQLKIEQESKNISIGESVRLVRRNKYIIIFAFILLLTFAISNMGAVVTLYYFEWIVGDLSLAAMLGLLGLAGPVVLLFFPLAMRKIGAIVFLKWAVAISIVGFIIRLFAGTNMPLIMVGSLLTAGIAFTSLVANIFLIQCMDYGEWKTGKRADGSVASLTDFTGKVGIGIGVGGVGLIMGFTGYDGMAEVQTGAANFAIVGLFSWIPAILSIILLVLLHMYDLDKRMPQIKEELEQRRKSVV